MDPNVAAVIEVTPDGGRLADILPKKIVRGKSISQRKTELKSMGSMSVSEMKSMKESAYSSGKTMRKFNLTVNHDEENLIGKF